MAFTTTNIKDAMDAELKDVGSFLSTSDKDEYVAAAIRELSRDRPLVIVEDLTGDGTQDYALPTTYEKAFSMVQEVETPAGEIVPLLRDPDDDWFEYEDPTKTPTLRLRFKETVPSATETIRITFTARHNQDASTLDDTEFQAVVFKALQLAFNALASRFSQGIDPTIAADTVDRASIGQNYLFSAERFRNAYQKLVGLDQPVKPAQGLAEFDIRFQHGEDMLLHSSRRR